MAARTTEDNQTLPAINQEEVRQALERILGSKHFIHAPKKQRFLNLVCAFYLTGRAGELNEYLIGREAFDRDEGYNPSADPIVRVGAHDVRKKLELYYQTEGARDEIRLEIPIGSYEPIFIRQSRPQADLTAKGATEGAVPPVSPLLVTPASSAGDARGWLLALSVAVPVLMIAVIILVFSNYQLRQQAQETAATRDPMVYGEVWAPFLKGGDQTLLVLSNPPVYRFSNVADPQVLIKKSISLSPEQANAMADTLKNKFFMRYNRNPRLILTDDQYTGLGEAIGLHRITDLFRLTGRSVLLKQSRTVSAEDLKDHNLILLGSVWVNEWSGKLPTKEEFIYTGNATIENLHPLAGEEREYQSVFDEQTGDLTADYALVTVKPNISSENTVMVLAGIRSQGTEAAAEFVTNKNYLNEFNQHLRQAAEKAGPPKYYQALLKVGVENGIPTTISLLAIHNLSKPEP